MMLFQQTVFVVGFVWLVLFSIRFSRFLHFHLRSADLSRYNISRNSWAIVTAGGGGIGYGFALELCRQGFNVVLTGHLESELDDAKARLAKEVPSVQVKCLVLDATTSSYASIESALSTFLDLNITILINNVGGEGTVFTERLKPYIRNTPEEIDSLININNRFMVYLTRILLPTLSKKSCPTLIVSLSSGSIIGIPYVTLYSATKSFVATFSRSLAIELRAENPQNQVQVTSIVPGDVHSKTHTPPVSWAIPTSEEYAKIVLAKVPGCGESVCVPYWRHAVLLKLAELLPTRFVEKSSTERMQMLRSMYIKVDEKRQKDM